MKRRGFLGLLGLAPAVPLLAKEIVKRAEPAAPVANTAPEPPMPTVRYEPRSMEFTGTAVDYCSIDAYSGSWYPGVQARYVRDDVTYVAIPRSPAEWRKR